MSGPGLTPTQRMALLELMGEEVCAWRTRRTRRGGGQLVARNISTRRRFSAGMVDKLLMAGYAEIRVTAFEYDKLVITNAGRVALSGADLPEAK